MVLPSGARGTRDNMRDFQILRFHASSCNNPLGELANLKQMQDGGLPAPVPILASTDSGLRPDQQVNLFTAGLRLRIDLGMQYLVNLGAAMNVAHALEREQQFNQAGGNRRTTPTWPTLKPPVSTRSPTLNRDSKGPGGAKPAAGACRPFY